MEDTNLREQDNRNATSFSLTDFRSKFYKERFDISPLDVGACWPAKDQFKSALVSTLHPSMVSQCGTEASGFVTANVLVNRTVAVGWHLG